MIKLHKLIKHKFSTFILVLFYVLLATPVLADDSEIYFTSQGSEGNPNILFVLDSSGSMARDVSGNDLAGGASNSNSRYQIMKRALQAAMSNVPNNFNVGLLNYSGHNDTVTKANGIQYPVKVLDATARKDMENEINSWTPQGWTPVVQSLYEASLYFKGLGVDYGAVDKPERQAHPESYTGGSAAVGSSEIEYKWCFADDASCQPPGATLVAGSCYDEDESCNKSNGQCDGVSYDSASCSIRTNWCNNTAGDCSGKTNTGACKNKYSWCNKTAGDCTGKGALTACYFKNDYNNCVGTLDENGDCSEWGKKEYCKYVKYEECPYAGSEYCDYPRKECKYQYEDIDYSTEWDATYISPIKAECQSNFMILLSDGEPNDGIFGGSDTDIVSKINSSYGLSCANQPSAVEDGKCGPELTEFLANQDQSTLTGDQWVKTYTVGFAVADDAQKYLKDVSNLGDTDNDNGDAGFFAAVDEKGLKDSLIQALEEINTGSFGLTQPVISIDTSTGLTHGDEVLVPMFRPSSLPRWLGNLKKYQLDVPATGPRLLDSTNSPVKDSEGKINETVRSYWLPTGDDPDGGNVAVGGTARLLGTGRNLKTDNPAGTALIDLNDASATDTLMGAGGDATLKTKLVRFAKGLDAETGSTALQHMGDIMHSTPVLFNYGNAHGSVVFVGTNEGYLHGINTSTGEEKFAFMPRELLGNIKTLYENDFNDSHPYGMDGPITLWHKDDNGNHVVDGSDRVYLYVGMRRGGHKYYALDVTNPSSPSLLWEVNGGAGSFNKLGQSWSKPVLAKVDLDGDNATAAKDVLIFGGGYDPDQDTATNRQTDDEGGAIYIVDASTGTRLWWADQYKTGSNSGDVDTMLNSIPADIRVLDIDGNGIHDRLYAADTGGRIYRVDLPDSNNGVIPASEKIATPQVTKLADLSSNGSIEHNRRFYSEPDSALVLDGRDRYMAISIGSGYRAHPLNQGADNAQDRLYMIKDKNVYSIPKLDSLSPIQHGANLVDLSSETDPETNVTNWHQKTGWYINLNRSIGEKALAEAFTLDNTVFFTTFQPESGTPADACSNAAHTARAYVMKVTNAKPMVTFSDTDTDLSGPQAERSVNYATNDIPTSVTVIAKKNTDPGKKGVVLHIMAGDGLSGSEGAGSGGGGCPGPNCLVDPKALDLIKVFWEEAE